MRDRHHHRLGLGWEDLQAQPKPPGKIKVRSSQGDRGRYHGLQDQSKGEKVTTSTGMVTDGESGAVLEVEILEGEDEEELKDWLGELGEELGVEQKC